MEKWVIDEIRSRHQIGDEFSDADIKQGYEKSLIAAQIPFLRAWSEIKEETLATIDQSSLGRFCIASVKRLNTLFGRAELFRTKLRRSKNKA